MDHSNNKTESSESGIFSRASNIQSTTPMSTPLHLESGPSLDEAQSYPASSPVIHMRNTSRNGEQNVGGKFRHRTQKRRCHTYSYMTTKSFLFLLASLLCININTTSFLQLPIAEAKIKLLPRTSSNGKNQSSNNLRQKVQEAVSSHNRKQHRPKRDQKKKKILLQPRPPAKKAAVASGAKSESMNGDNASLSLQATIGKNENGDPVLLLSPDSTAMVQNAMAQQQEEEHQGVQQQTQQEEDMQVFFYDPKDLQATKPGDEPQPPSRIFDKDGNEVELDGEDAILIPPSPPVESKVKVDDKKGPPPPPPHSEPEEVDDDTKDESSETSSESNNSGSSTGASSGSGNTKTNKSSSGSSSKSGKINFIDTPQAHDQMIIISTVATMALLVGAVTARRLRSRQFLSFCIENESLEDDLAYDAAYTTQSTVGSSLYGGGYDTFATGASGVDRYTGDLRWRGDLEKFDV